MLNCNPSLRKQRSTCVANISLLHIFLCKYLLQGDHLSKDISSIDEELRHKILDFCRRLAGTAKITAISLLDTTSTTPTMVKAPLEIVVVIRDFQLRLLSYVKVIDGRSIIVFAVDQWVFDRDVERGFLGEALASTLIFPYIALNGRDYLHTQEILLKKRLILEVLSNLVLSSPELSYLLRIKPQYFMYEAMLNRIRVFPPMAYGISNFMHGKLHRKETESILHGYIEALQQLEKEKKITLSEGYVIIPKTLVAESKSPKVRLANISKNAPRTLFTSLFGVFPQLLNFLSQNTEALLKIQKFTQRREATATRHFVDPQKYVFVPTAEGLVSLADRVDIKAFAQKLFLHDKNAKIKLERVGGVLNDVYLIKAYSQGAEKKVLVKRFKDWSGFKWFPLTLWSLGARTFTVLGRYRLESECAMSELLRNAGFNVPKILHISHSERLVFMEYIEGENLTSTIKRIAAAKNEETPKKDLAKIMMVGETLARVHALDFALGDTKPENIIIDPTDRIYLLDFEQASHSGDKAWDVAEFLYYSGHYLPPLNSNSKAESIANAFIQGYLKAGGDINNIKNAGAPKYTRVFSIFTPPSVILAMSNVCKKLKQ
jgi:tRNA A-37 threonylcarbamoyl transferase component Bud32